MTDFVVHYRTNSGVTLSKREDDCETPDEARNKFLASYHDKYYRIVKIKVAASAADPTPVIE